MEGLLTQKQKDILAFIRERVTRDRLPPTIREIAGRFGFSSTGTVRDHLAALERKGYLSFTRQKARAIALDNRLFGIPVCGRVQAGEPKLAQQDIEGYLEPYAAAEGEELFCLRVKGESMRDAGILEGDLAVVRRQPAASDGDIVVAAIEDEATVKTLRRKGKAMFLCPANERFKPIPVTPEVKILGKVVSVVRRYV